jgi:hypothetical protein
LYLLSKPGIYQFLPEPGIILLSVPAFPGI